MSATEGEIFGQQVELLRERFRAAGCKFISIHENPSGRFIDVIIGVRKVRTHWRLDGVTLITASEIVGYATTETQFSEWVAGIINGATRDDLGHLVLR
jgi:hypothetical protein